MDFNRAFKPTKWKIAFALIPAIIPFAYTLLYIDYYLNFGSWLGFVINSANVYLIFYIGYPLSLPFEPFLTLLGLWESDTDALGWGTMATFGGYVLLAFIYSVFFYLLYSIVSLAVPKPKR